MCQGDLAAIDRLRLRLPAVTMDTFPGLGFRTAEKTAAKGGGGEQLAQEFKLELKPFSIVLHIPFPLLSAVLPLSFTERSSLDTAGVERRRKQSHST